MRVPTYRLHKPSGQAVVEIKRKCIYLGQFGTPESHRKYHQVIADYLAIGGEVPSQPAKLQGLTIGSLCAVYLQWARSYYCRDEFVGRRSMAKRLTEVVGELEASRTTPRTVELFRQACIDSGNTRKYINQQVGRLVAMFKWAVAQEMVETEVWMRLRAITGLKRGRSKATEKPRIKPVDDMLFNQAIEAMPDDLSAMLQLQRYTGMRPGEVWILRPCDVDRSGDVWRYTPSHHKTEHHGRDRVIYIGPRGQSVLSPFLLRDSESLCFTNDGAPWTRYTYRKHIHRWCRHAGLPTFNPNQIRHSVATEVRDQFGLDGAQVMLGHSQADVTQIYAELNHKRGEEIAKRIG